MDNRKITNAMNFYLWTARLTDKVRSGWDDKHWSISKERRESVAEHVYKVCNLAIALTSEFDLGVDLAKVLKMLIIHEIGEARIGDITPFDGMTPEKKRKMESEAVVKAAGFLAKKEEIISLWLEFEDKKTPNATFAYLCDKLDADLQSKLYQDMGCHNSLEEQENNVVFQSEKIKQIVKNGAETAFDVWYEYDKSIYEDSPIFMAMLDFAKEHNIKKMQDEL